MISTCYRLKYLTFESVGMNIPIEPNRKRGRPKATASALQRQDENIEEDRGIDGDEDDNENPLLRRTQRRQQKRNAAQLESTRIQPTQDQYNEQNKNCPKCDAVMLKKTLSVLSQ